jgi:hypothetical protein
MRMVDCELDPSTIDAVRETPTSVAVMVQMPLLPEGTDPALAVNVADAAPAGTVT